jgi:hypothetical protein
MAALNNQRVTQDDAMKICFDFFVWTGYVDARIECQKSVTYLHTYIYILYHIIYMCVCIHINDYTDINIPEKLSEYVIKYDRLLIFVVVYLSFGSIYPYPYPPIHLFVYLLYPSIHVRL